MKGRGDGLLFLVVVGRGQKTNETDSFVLTIPMSHLMRKLCQQGLPQFLCLISIAQTWNPYPFVFCPRPGFSSFGADLRLACSGETLFYI